MGAVNYMKNTSKFILTICIAFFSLISIVEAAEITSGELVRVNKLIRDINSVKDSIDTTGSSKFQKQAEVNKYTKRFNQFTQAIERYQKYNHPNVKQAYADYIVLSNVLNAEFKRGQQQLSSVGDVQGILKSLEANLFANRAPKQLIIPFTKIKAQAWVKIAVNATKTAQVSKEEIQRIAQEADLEKSNRGTVSQGAPYDQQDINRLNRLADNTIFGVTASRDATYQDLKTQLTAMNTELDYFRNLDPDKPSDKANAFLKEGAAENIHSRLNDILAKVNSVVYFVEALEKKAPENVVALSNEITQLKTTYDKNRESAIGAYKLPEAQSIDPKLMEIAKSVVEIERYEFGQNGPIILTTDQIIDKERTESEEKFTDLDVSISGDITLTGTKTTWTYKWKEFKFATPLMDENGKWYVWWITARNYSSGGRRTPIGQWVAGTSTKGSQIRKENF